MTEVVTGEAVVLDVPCAQFPSRLAALDATRTLVHSTSSTEAPASARAVRMFSTAFAAWPAYSPGTAVDPSAFSGHAPARTISRAPAGAVAAYAYSATPDKDAERISVMAPGTLMPP